MAVVHFNGSSYRSDVKREDIEFNYTAVKSELNKLPLEIKKECKEECIRASEKSKINYKKGGYTPGCAFFCKFGDIELFDDSYENFNRYCKFMRILNYETHDKWEI